MKTFEPIIDPLQSPDDENAFWQKVALQEMTKVYKGEPNFSDVTLIEPNPTYQLLKIENANR